MEILNIKAQNNLKVAESAIKDDCYDAAVSRYYYYIFLKIMIILHKRGEELRRDSGLSHSQIISDFLKICKEEGIYSETQNGRSLVKLWGLKDKRIISEYSKDDIIHTEEMFKEIFYKDYNEVISVLRRLNFIGE